MLVRQIRDSRIIRMFTLTAAVGLLGAAASTPAYASNHDFAQTGKPSISRVLDLRGELVPSSANVRLSVTKALRSPGKVMKVRGVTNLPVGVVLAVGEAVQVNYADGVVVYERIAAACTVSRTAYTPSKYTTPTNRIAGAHSVSSSASCPTFVAYGNVMQGTAPNGASVAQTSRQITPNGTTTWATSVNCQASSSNKFFSRTSGYSGVAYSATATLSCVV